mmetsp:Transcript_59605/g.104863  ORF Transcript_59605/g.104863 Transcript_59605/m.104863 type:complete len:131 (-) Transcript_59605:72-464(-)|eukprot:CAMPEP_0184969366 /NCGR_PEP_ID=MMETSP1098-20130426/2131_1 /TAXON_ID=89044 /ORGANISM="Spumella elongata, Strain CCAP 955/1" /LENGTH=130 /DNA_ID=CAMNT_0027491119 /DNA_START=68 /DNA_END=460 /DNA_ORIENTATION=-
MASVAVTKAPAEEVDVRLVDQEKINEFGRLNNRLLEIRADVVQCKADSEKMDDATAEMMMSTDGKFMLLIGESFVEVDEDYATEYCEGKLKALQAKVAKLSEEETDILKRQELLKKELYGRFGDSINLEN